MIVFRVFALLSLTIFLSCSSDTDNSTPTFQNEVDFITTYGGTKNESAQAIVNTTDGGYAILGFTQSMDFDVVDKDNESFDFWLTKFNTQGNLQWSKTYGGTNDDRGQDLIQTSDGGYAILGYTQSSDQDITENAGFTDYWLAKLDNQGNLIWQKSFGYSGADTGSSIIQTSDGGYFLTGILDVTASGGEGNTNRNSLRHAGGDFWALKLDASGNIEWSNYYGGSLSETPYDAIETMDGNYLIVGSSDSNDVDITNNKGSYDFWVVKISNTGTIIWQRSFGGEQIDEAKSVVETSNGNYLIVGDVRSSDQDVSTNLGAADLWVLTVSENGNLLSEKTFGGSSFDAGNAIIKSNNGFIICGNSRSQTHDLIVNNGQNDAWVFKIGSNLNIEWSRTIGSSAIDTFYAVTELNNGEVLAVGETNAADFDIQENKGFSDLLILKLK